MLAKEKKRKKKKYYTWDKLTEEFLLKYPELRFYYNHIKDIREIDF